MKKVLSIIIFLAFPAMIFAATKPATPSATGVSKEVQNKIDDLKERLATKVAELRKSTPRAIYGTVTQVSVSSITVDAAQKAYKIELTDSIKVAQLLKAKRTALTTDDISKNDVLTVFGDFDDTLDILQAKNIFIEAAKLPVRLHGTIGEIDKKNNAFTLKGVDDASYKIDVESTTKNNAWANGKTDKGGFSKLETGMFVTVVGMENPKEADRYSALRILTVKVDSATATSSVSPTPTMEAASPSATPKTKTISTTPTKKVTATPKVTPTTKTTPKSTP